MKILVSQDSIALIEAHLLPGRRLEGVRSLENGQYEIELEDKIYAHLKSIDDDMDRAIAGLCLFCVGHA